MPIEPRPPRIPAFLWVALGRWGGVPLFVEPIVLGLALLALVVLLPAGSLETRLLLTLLLLASVLVHETGHAVAARCAGTRVHGIYLHVVPMVWVGRGRVATIALAGPAASLLLAAGLWALGGLRWPPPALALEQVPLSPWSLALWLNVALGVVNLIPALPLDGGHALAALLRRRLPPLSARRVAGTVGLALSAALAGAAVVGFACARHPLALPALLLAAILAYFGRRAMARSRADRSRRLRAGALPP